MPSATQNSSSTTIIRQSLLMFLLGATGGMFVPNTPFPRLALVAHIEAMTNASMWLALGLLLRSDFMGVSDLGLQVVKISLATNWITLVVEVLNAWWGTKGILPIAAEQAGAIGAAAPFEAIVTLGHVVPGVSLVVAFAVLLHASYTKVEEKKRL